MKAILDSEAIRIAHIAATEAIPALTCVKIGDCKIVAADGFLLAIREIVTEPAEGESILVPAQALLSARRLLPKRDIVVESDEKNIAHIRYNELPELEILAPILTSGTFPAYEVIVPTEPCQAFVTIDPKKLNKAIKAFDKVDGWCTQFKLRGKDKPVEIISGSTKILVMPIFAEEKK